MMSAAAARSAPGGTPVVPPAAQPEKASASTTGSGSLGREVESLAAPSPPRNTPVSRHWERPRAKRYDNDDKNVELRRLQQAADPGGPPVVYQTLMPVLRHPPTQQPYPGRRHGNYGSSDSAGSTTATLRSFRETDRSVGSKAEKVLYEPRLRYPQMHLGEDSETSDWLPNAKQRGLISDSLWPKVVPSDLSMAPPRSLPPIAVVNKRKSREIVVPHNLGDIIQRKLEGRENWPPSTGGREASMEED